MSREERAADALRQIAAGFTALADAVAAVPATGPATVMAGEPEPVMDPAAVPIEERERALIAEWGERGLTRDEARALFRKYGFAPQAAGGLARGRRLELRDDGRRYLVPGPADRLRDGDEGDRG